MFICELKHVFFYSELNEDGMQYRESLVKARLGMLKVTHMCVYKTDYVADKEIRILWIYCKIVIRQNYRSVRLQFVDSFLVILKSYVNVYQNSAVYLFYCVG